VSSVSVAAYQADVGAEFRIQRAEDSLRIAGTTQRGSSNLADRAVKPAADPTIILFVHSSSGLDAASLESFNHAHTQSLGGDATFGFTRVIPDAALPAVREAYAQFRRQFGNAGTITALALERRPEEASPTQHDSRDLRDSEGLEFAEISIDPARREVWVEGSLISLTKSEFDLLYVLAQRPGVVFSRRQIVLAYKGADYPVDDRSIDVQMFNLRRKIRSAGSVLQTIRGVGYRFAGKPVA
jgi:DNA-binding winged helix-turn-helix (wHTH) protein